MEGRGQALNALVIDASALGPIFFEDEADRIAELEALIVSEDIIVPACWSFEIANMILMAVRKQRIAPDSQAELLALATGFQVVQDDASIHAALSASFAMASRHNLTVYDAAYLELAIRRGAALATLDKALVRAAQAEHVRVYTK